MRIIGGKWKRRKLNSSFNLKNSITIRPTTDRIKENIFNIVENLNNDNPLLGARVLDLFCGTGALGLEALSRGANFCHFIDNSPEAKRITLENINKLGTEKHVLFTRADILGLSINNNFESDIVFLDPPYGKDLCEQAISVLLKQGWVKRNAIFILEKEVSKKLNCDLRIIERRQYGKSEINILRSMDF